MRTVECKKCGETKPHSAKGLCANCYKKAAYYQQNKEGKLAYQKRYAEKNKEKISARNKINYAKKKKEQAKFNRRIKGALRKAEESEKRIIKFFGVK